LHSGAVGGVETSANAGFTNAPPSAEDTNLLNLMNGGLAFGNGVPLTLTITAAPDTSYRIDTLISLLGYNNDDGRTVTVGYNGGSVADTIAFTNSNSIYDVEDIVQSNSQGTIVVDYNGSEGPFYSGLVVSAVPEPSTYAMMFAGLAFLGFRLRRKSAPFQA
jgi:hypothetical protein